MKLSSVPGVHGPHEVEPDRHEGDGHQYELRARVEGGEAEGAEGGTELRQAGGYLGRADQADKLFGEECIFYKKTLFFKKIFTLHCVFVLPPVIIRFVNFFFCTFCTKISPQLQAPPEGPLAERGGAGSRRRSLVARCPGRSGGGTRPSGRSAGGRRTPRSGDSPGAPYFMDFLSFAFLSTLIF